MQRLRRYFITGFFVTVPLLISVYALVKIFEIVDGLTTPLYDQILQRRVPGLGTLISLGAPVGTTWTTTFTKGSVPSFLTMCTSPAGSKRLPPVGITWGVQVGSSPS